MEDWRRIDSANGKMASLSLLYCITEQHTSVLFKGIVQPQKSHDGDQSF
jgi:hypothetical protein